MKTPTASTSVLLVFIVAFALRSAVAVAAGALTHPELFEPDTLARSMLAGRGFVYVWHGGVVYHSLMAPLYPWLSALMYWTPNGTPVRLMILQILVSSLTAVFVWWIGTRLFSRPAALVAGLLVAVHPGLIVYASLKAHELTFDIITMLAVFWQWVRLQQERTASRAVRLGLASGLGLLERPTALVFLPVGALWFALTTARGAQRAMAGQVAIAAICAGLVIAPWTIRNLLVQHRLVFIRSTDWEVFWRGNNPHATGHSYTEAGGPVFGQLQPDAVAELESLRDENQQAAWFRRQAFAFIREQPWVAATRTLMKWYYFWWFSPESGTLYPRYWRLTYEGFYVCIVALAAVGATHVASSGTKLQLHAVSLIGGMMLGISVLQCLYYVEGRHRWAVEPLMLVLTGIGVSTAGSVIDKWLPGRATERPAAT